MDKTARFVQAEDGSARGAGFGPSAQDVAAMDAFSAGVPLATTLARLAAAAGVGASAGAAYFTALWWNVALFDQGATPRALALLLVRFGLLAAVFLALAKGGAAPLLAGAAGLFVARRFVLRRFGKL